MSRLILDVAYHRTYGLNEGVDVNNPLNPVLVRPRVIHAEENPMYTFCRHFMKTRVGEHFNISFMEFLRLPPYMCEYLLDLAMKQTTEAGAAVSRQAAQLAGLEKGLS